MDSKYTSLEHNIRDILNKKLVESKQINVEKEVISEFAQSQPSVDTTAPKYNTGVRYGTSTTPRLQSPANVNIPNQTTDPSKVQTTSPSKLLKLLKFGLKRIPGAEVFNADELGPGMTNWGPGTPYKSREEFEKSVRDGTHKSPHTFYEPPVEVPAPAKPAKPAEIPEFPGKDQPAPAPMIPAPAPVVVPAPAVPVTKPVEVPAPAPAPVVIPAPLVTTPGQITTTAPAASTAPAAATRPAPSTATSRSTRSRNEKRKRRRRLDFSGSSPSTLSTSPYFFSARIPVKNTKHMATARVVKKLKEESDLQEALPLIGAAVRIAAPAIARIVARRAAARSAARSGGRSTGRRSNRNSLDLTISGDQSQGTGPTTTPTPGQPEISRPNIQVTNTRHLADPRVVKKLKEETATEIRQKIENVSRPNKPSQLGKTGQIKMKIIDENKKMANIIRRVLQDKKNKKNNGNNLVDTKPKLKNPNLDEESRLEFLMRQQKELTPTEYRNERQKEWETRSTAKRKASEEDAEKQKPFQGPMPPKVVFTPTVKTKDNGVQPSPVITNKGDRLTNAPAVKEPDPVRFGTGIKEPITQRFGGDNDIPLPTPIVVKTRSFLRPEPATTGPSQRLGPRGTKALSSDDEIKKYNASIGGKTSQQQVSAQIRKNDPATTTAEAPKPAAPVDNNTTGNVKLPDTNVPVPTQRPTSAQPSSYKIKARDTLSTLARQNNTTVAAIMKANPNIKDPNKIRAGASIILPVK
jgi:LysM repeat protein